MNIKLEIFADNAAELMTALRTLMEAGGPAPVIVTGTDAPEPQAEAPKSETRRGRPAKNNVVDLQSVKKTEPEKTAESDAAPAEDVQPAEPEESLDETPAAPTVELTVDLVRKYAVKYVNEVAKASGITDSAEQQSKAREAFNDLLKEFGAGKFTEIDAAKMADVHAWIVDKRAAAKLPALDIATLV